MTDAKPAFKRQESWRYKRVKENWRRPRGVTSKMRKEESGWPHKVKIGYGTKSSSRGLHPRGLVDRLVWRLADLEKLDPKIDLVRIAHRVGERKRLDIVDRAKQLNFHIANPGKQETRPPAEEPVKEEKATPTEVAEETSKTETRDESVEERDEVVETTEEPTGTEEETE